MEYAMPRDNLLFLSRQLQTFGTSKGYYSYLSGPIDEAHDSTVKALRASAKAYDFEGRPQIDARDAHEEAWYQHNQLANSMKRSGQLLSADYHKTLAEMHSKLQDHHASLED
jgi:hypothetical protein